mmetsp:Transcript_978/g.1229  ORF Transcript_978/g.1229 Transcript_978/m.1229 type:complete len:331 (+) Transcript_978:158-1150(+)
MMSSATPFKSKVLVLFINFVIVICREHSSFVSFPSSTLLARVTESNANTNGYPSLQKLDAKLVFNEDEECLAGISSEDIDQKLRISIDNLYANFLDPDGDLVDYKGLRKSEEFKEYKKQAAELKNFDISVLEDKARKAFFLNIYNALVIHGLVQMGEPKSWDDRLVLYSSASYIIGGKVLSLDDIEHGILRGNTVGGSHNSIPFAEGDDRRSLVLDLDPRIHFALNCGAISCPPIRFYEADDIDDQLDISTEAYLEDIQIEELTQTVRLPKILEWYQSDFTGPSPESPVAILEWVLPFVYEEEKRARLQKIVQSGNVNIEYLPYNWDLNE